MKISVSHFNEQNENLYGYLSAGWTGGADNSEERRRMKRLLRMAVSNGLTEQQKQCLLRYYSGTKQKDIAAEMGLSPSTVNRHIKAALRRLQNIAQYYS